jgi:DNA-binding NarL/FixJ family response regulator
MEIRSVFVVGDSLYAETLVQVLGDSETVVVSGTAPTPEEALPLLQRQSPDAVIVAVADESVVVTFAPILIANPNLPIIHADLNTNQVQVITNQSIDARTSDLLAAIAALPKRAVSIDEKTSDE